MNNIIYEILRSIELPKKNGLHDIWKNQNGWLGSDLKQHEYEIKIPNILVDIILKLLHIGGLYERKK